MKHPTTRQALVVAAVVVAAATPSHGALPLVAGFGKQLIKDMLIDGVKSQLMGTLAGSGCKGAAVASLLGGSPSRSFGSLLGGGAGGALAGGMGLPAGAIVPLGAGPVTSADTGAATLRAATGAAAMPALPPGLDPRTMNTPQMAALMQQMGSSVPAMPAMSPEQVAHMNSALAAMQQAMAQPLSPAETKAVFDELGTLGVMTPAMQSEMNDCLALAPASASAGMGTSAALMKTMVLPQLRAAREQMANLTPEQREQMADEIAQAMRDAEPEDRKAFADGFGVGFFPPEVVDAVRAKLR